MSDGKEQQSAIEEAIAQLVANGRLTRRDFLKRASQGGAYVGGALSLSAILAACGISPAASPSAASASATAAATAAATPEPTPVPTPAGQLNFANWPLYIDTDDNGNHPTLQDFTTATGIKVTYTEDIEDNQSFFGKIQPDLAAGNDTGYDLMVLTDWLIGKMVGLNYLEQIDIPTFVPNFAAHAADKYKNPTYDPNNAHSVPWQSGITGIAYNPKKTGREITSFADLFDPKFKDHVGLFTEMRDTMNLALLGIGVKPTDATIDDVTKAQQYLLDHVSVVRNFYGNEYADALAKGDLWVTMAWSGDIFQLDLDPSTSNLKFVVPSEGGILWVDNMCIPNKAQHPVDAQMMMNFVYQPKIAAQITEWVNYICPVPEAQAIIKQDAADAKAGGDSETADYLNAVADSPLVFPTADMLSKVYSYKVLTEAEEAQWNSLFQQVVQG